MTEKLDISLQDLPGLLSRIPADDREVWLQVGMGIKAEFGEEGFDLWDNWSSSSSSYDRSAVKSSWKSFRKSGVGFGTVIKLAQDNGWKPEKNELTVEEKKRFKAEQEERRKQREAEIAADEEKTARLQDVVVQACDQIIREHGKPLGKSEYLLKKQIKGFGALFIHYPVLLVIDDQSAGYQIFTGPAVFEFFNQYKSGKSKIPEHLHVMKIEKGSIIVPMHDIHDALCGLQTISGSGTKLFPKYCRKSSSFHLLGEITDKSGYVAFAEGFATGASVHMAMGWPVVCCWDRINLVKVAVLFRNRYPSIRMIIAGDDDTETKDNPGRKAAEQAALDVGGMAVFPIGDKSS